MWASITFDGSYRNYVDINLLLFTVFPVWWRMLIDFHTTLTLLSIVTLSKLIICVLMIWKYVHLFIVWFIFYFVLTRVISLSPTSLQLLCNLIFSLYYKLFIIIQSISLLDPLYYLHSLLHLRQLLLILLFYQNLFYNYLSTLSPPHLFHFYLLG